MTAETVSIGTELLLGDIVDTNAAYLAKVLAEYGVFQRFRQTVGDNPGRLSEALGLALSRSDIVVTIGGLGPTSDDVTRSSIAESLGDTLVLDESAATVIRERLAARRIVASPVQLRQAMRPTCATMVANTNGTAPGLLCEKDGKTVIALPGPKGEFNHMVDTVVRDWLRGLCLGSVVSGTVHVVGMGETVVEEILQDLMGQSDPTVAPYAKTGEVHVRVSVHRTDGMEAARVVSATVEEVVRRLGRNVYSREGHSLEAALINHLVKFGQTIATAESCTGGWLAKSFTAVPGSSQAFLGSIVSYTNAMKAGLLGVPMETLERYGAVSEQCAASMAEGARKAIGSDWAVSTTGIAGPDGGTAEKPVGLVYIGIAGPNGTTVKRELFPGDRETVRERSVRAALAHLYFQLTPD